MFDRVLNSAILLALVALAVAMTTAAALAIIGMLG